MKKILIFMLFLCLSVYASENNFSKVYTSNWDRQIHERERKSVKNTHEVYISYSIGRVNSEKETILGSQPLGEIVGTGGTVSEIKIGLNTKTGYEPYLDKFRVYSYLWKNSEKNNESGFGFGGDIVGHYFNKIPRLGLLFGTQVGFGKQGVNGTSKMISSSVNKFTFVTDKANTNPTEMTYTKDTYVLNIALNLGIVVNISKHLSTDLTYGFTRSEYQFSYRTKEDSNFENSLTETQYNHIVKAELIYTF